MSLVHRLKYALTLVTIEPMVLVQGVADYIAEVPEAQMVLYKTCRGRQRTVRTNEQTMEHLYLLSFRTKSRIFYC